MKEYFDTDIKMSDVESLLETKLEGTSYTLKERSPPLGRSNSSKC